MITEVSNNLSERFLTDEKQFQRLVQLRQPMLLRFGLRLLNDVYIIENIVQDAFLKLWNFRDTITSTEHAERFLMQSVKWACYSYFRNASSRFHRRMVQLDGFDNFDDFIFADFAECNSDLDDDVEQSKIDAIKEAISKVCFGREKEVMELHFIKGLTHTQIAERFNVSVTTVTMILEKGKLRLKTLLVTATDSHTVEHGSSITSFIEKLKHIEGLNAEQNMIYQLRATGKYEFEQIASFLDLPVSFVQLEYVLAFKIAGGQRKKNKGRSAGKQSGRPGVLTSRLSA